MRISDTERGARIALEIADIHMQLDLFDVDLDQLDFWSSIRSAALEQLEECVLLRQALCL